MSELPHIPVLRAGVEYESLEQEPIVGFRDGAPLAKVSRANAGIIRRDLRKAAGQAEALRALSSARLLEICAEAGELFLNATLPLNGSGDSQSPQEFVEALSATSGLPHGLVRRNMDKVATVFRSMPEILRGLTRGLDPSVIDEGFGEVNGIPVCYAPTTDNLGVVLPSNSPGVNSIWMPAIALKTPVILKPGREEPWTPLRILQAFIAAGCPREAFGFYPSDHEGAASLLELCGRSLLFGDQAVTQKYASNPAVQIHGPGRSKVIVGEDLIDDWREHLDVLVRSVLDNGGRSCINASSIFVPAHAAEIAGALAERLAGVEPLSAEDPESGLCAFPNTKFADWIDDAIEAGLKQGGARDVTAERRDGRPRRIERDGATYLLPTVILCDSVEHPLAGTEYLFPFTSVVQVPQERVLDAIGPSLVVTGLTRDPAFQRRLIDSPHIDRLNLGAIPTSRVEWDQPHEGNLFEFLYQRRAIQRESP